MGTINLEPGQRFGRWTVLERAGSNKDHRALWKCRCDCGTIKNVVGRDLRGGKSKGCGCVRVYKEPHYIDLTGQQFGRLRVISPESSNTRGLKRWLCECECGTRIIVNSNDLRTGHTTSCGCLRSKGEQKISELLLANHIPFEKEKRFESCISNKRAARFDFFVNNSYCIEYDGIQHYEETMNNEWNYSLKDIQRRDINKNKWCQQNNIPLIRIPYWHYDQLTINDLLLETSSFLVSIKED